jgi:hypothetical protein
VLLLVACACCASGQTVNVTILAGPNLSTYVPGINSSEGGGVGAINAPGSPIFGFHAAGYVDFTAGKLGIQTGLLLESIGGELGNVQTFSLGSPAYQESIRVQYAQIPLNILFYIPYKTGKFFVGGGPYIAFGLWGSTSFTTYSNEDGSYKFSSTDDPDYGFNLVAGIHVKGNFEFSLGYGMGLRYLSDSKDSPDDKLKDNVYSFSVGHTIW